MKKCACSVRRGRRAASRRRCRKLGSARSRKRFFFEENRSAPAIYFTRVDAIIIGARSAIELISAAKPLDREVYELTQMERVRRKRVFSTPTLSCRITCAYTVLHIAQENEKNMGKDRARAERGGTAR